MSQPTLPSPFASAVPMSAAVIERAVLPSQRQFTPSKAMADVSRSRAALAASPAFHARRTVVMANVAATPSSSSSSSTSRRRPSPSSIRPATVVATAWEPPAKRSKVTSAAHSTWMEAPASFECWLSNGNHSPQSACSTSSASSSLLSFPTAPRRASVSSAPAIHSPRRLHLTPRQSSAPPVHRSLIASSQSIVISTSSEEDKSRVGGGSGGWELSNLHLRLQQHPAIQKIQRALEGEEEEDEQHSKGDEQSEESDHTLQHCNKPQHPADARKAYHSASPKLDESSDESIITSEPEGSDLDQSYSHPIATHRPAPVQHQYALSSSSSHFLSLPSLPSYSTSSLFLSPHDEGLVTGDLFDSMPLITSSDELTWDHSGPTEAEHEEQDEHWKDWLDLDRVNSTSHLQPSQQRC